MDAVEFEQTSHWSIDQLRTAFDNVKAALGVTQAPGRLLAGIANALIKNSPATVVLEYVASPGRDDPSLSVLANQYHQVPTNVEHWATQTAIKSLDSNAVAVESSIDESGNAFHLIAVPLDEKNQTSLVALFCNDTPECLPELAAIQLAVQATQLRQQARGPAANPDHVVLDIAAIQELNSKIGRADSSTSACQRIADLLATQLLQLSQKQDGIRAYVATVTETGKPNLVAVSGLDTVPEDRALVDALESAMAECITRNAESHWPPTVQDRHALLCHRTLSETMQVENLFSTVFAGTKEVAQCIVLVASVNKLPERSRRFLNGCGEPFGATLSLVQRAEQNKLQRWITSVRESLGKEKTKLIARCAAVVFALGLTPLPYKINSECEVQPTSKRFVSAPFDAKLNRCLVEPGDTVEAGQVLAELDETEIKLELAEVAADFHRASKKRDGFVASHESGEARLAQYEAQGLRARNDLLTSRTENLELRSPIEGVVIAGDHKDTEGMPVEQGQSLFEIAPLNSFSIDVFIPQSDVRYAQEGMKVKVRLDSFPFESWTGLIERIHPASEIHNEKNVFVASVKIEEKVANLRPGMQGSAKVSSVWRPIWWNYLHKPVANCLRYVGW